MKRIISLLFVFLPICLQAQNLKCINFENGLNWEQVKEKAMNENKYVFVDCFATWCGPCKRMDKEVYVSPKIVDITNKEFISVRLQFDRTKSDDEQIKHWYTTVDQFNRSYKIAGFPTFLFFSPNGQLIHQDMGYKNEHDFYTLLNDVLSPSTQFGRLFKNYKDGQRDSLTVLKAAIAAKKLGNKESADSIARFFKVQYLNRLSNTDLLQKDLIQFVAQEFPFLFYEEGSKGAFFNLFYSNSKSVDSLLGNGYSDFYIKSIIIKEELHSKLYNNNKPIWRNPKWNQLKANISNKYSNELAKKIVEEYRLLYYRQTRNWVQWAKLFDKKIKKSTLYEGSKVLSDWGDDWVLNDNAWTIFKYCNEKKVLRQALKWSELALLIKKDKKGFDGYLDTKANLLYKMGKKELAISWEMMALEANNEFARKEGKEKGSFFEEFTNNLNKMRSGLPTWKTGVQ